MSIIFLYSKDAFSIENIPIYGNKYWKTPNLDEMAKKGTVFNKHYTTAVSTSMVFSSILTGKYPYEFENRKQYVHVPVNEKLSIFSKLQERGYECHILWSEDYMTGAWPYVREFGDETKTKIHVLNIHEPVGRHHPQNYELKRNDELLIKTKESIYNELNNIDISSDNVFIWLHLPHVLKGRVSYGDDIDVVDEILGFIREKYGDENIYITADHGHMNLHKNIPGYGFDVYELSARVPLISPKINNVDTVDFITSHVDFALLLLEKEIVKRDYIYVDSQYYAQSNRKLAVVTNRFKYIYNKRTKTEELYDIEWDSDERYNLLETERFDRDRKIARRVSELYFYPYRSDIESTLLFLREKKNDIWRVGTRKDEFLNRMKNDIKGVINYIKFTRTKKD